MHTTINRTVEQEEQNSLLGTDFYRTLKIDNHIHAAAAPSAKQFVEFVRRKLESEGDTIVSHDGQTLTEVFQAAGIKTDHLTIDAFNVLADYSVYQRFDNFNRCVASYQNCREVDFVCVPTHGIFIFSTASTRLSGWLICAEFFSKPTTILMDDILLNS